MEDLHEEEKSDSATEDFVRRPAISGPRRRELNALALSLAEQVERLTRPHERCLLRRMVESFFGG